MAAESQPLGGLGAKPLEIGPLVLIGPCWPLLISSSVGPYWSLLALLVPSGPIGRISASMHAQLSADQSQRAQARYLIARCNETGGNIGESHEAQEGLIGPQGQLFWGLCPQTPIWSAFSLHMDPFRVHMDPKTHWGPYGPILKFWILGPYIGSSWNPT